MSCFFGINEMKHSSYSEDAVQTAISIKKNWGFISSIKNKFSVEIDISISNHYSPAIFGNIKLIDDLRFGVVRDAY